MGLDDSLDADRGLPVAADKAKTRKEEDEECDEKSLVVVGFIVVPEDTNIPIVKTRISTNTL